MSNGVLFWLIAFALVVATLAALVVPLLRRASERPRPAEADASAAIYRDQTRQLEEDVATGVIGADERTRAHEEIVARLGDELAATPAPAAATPSPRAAWVAAIVIVALLPASALVAYFALGNPRALDARAAQQRHTEPEIVAMVERLAERMKAQPDDPQVGFIAEDVPEIVATPDRKTLNPLEIVAVLAKVVKEQQKTIEALSKRVGQLEDGH